MIGMFTRLIFEEALPGCSCSHESSRLIGVASPELADQWSRTDRSPRPRLRAYRRLDCTTTLVPLVVRAEVQPGAGEMDLVLADLVAQQAPGRAVLVDRDGETACKIAQP